MVILKKKAELDDNSALQSLLRDDAGSEASVRDPAWVLDKLATPHPSPALNGELLGMARPRNEGLIRMLKRFEQRQDAGSLDGL